MRRYFTMWQVWAGISVILGMLIVFKTGSFASILPFGLLLICPIMMIFMMRGHKHK